MLQKWFSPEQWEIFLQCAMINMKDRQNEYWDASPLRPKSGSNTLLHCVFSFCRLLSLKTQITVFMRILAKTGILTDAYTCVYVIVQSRQKWKSVLLSNRKRRRTHIALLFEFQRLKISLYQTAVIKNAWPCYRCSPSFRNELLVVSWLLVLHLFLSVLHAPWWAAYKDCSHSNDEKLLPETMYFATPRYKR